VRLQGDCLMRKSRCYAGRQRVSYRNREVDALVLATMDMWSTIVSGVLLEALK
jgi:hypothetical protein